MKHRRVTAWHSGPQVAVTVALATVCATLLLVLDADRASADDQWTHTYGTQDPANYSTATGVVVAGDVSIFVVGAFFGEFEGLVSEDGFDAFLMRLTATGQVVWTSAGIRSLSMGRPMTSLISTPSAVRRGCTILAWGGSLWTVPAT